MPSKPMAVTIRNTQRFFAIGLKGWVQIRTAAKPPKGTTSSTTVTVKRRVRDWIPGYLQEDRWINSRMVEKVVEQPMKLTATTYTGGRVIKTLKSSLFASRLKVGMREGGLMELLPEQMARLTEVVR